MVACMWNKRATVGWYEFTCSATNGIHGWSGPLRMRPRNRARNSSATGLPTAPMRRR